MKLLVTTKKGISTLIEPSREPNYKEKYLQVDGTPFVKEVVSKPKKKAGRPKGSKNLPKTPKKA